MKKFVAFIFMLVLTQNSFACVCAYEISQSFKKYEMELTKALKMQQTSLKTLQSSIKNSTSKLDEQNMLITNENELFKAEILKQRELIFELKRKIKLR